MLVRLTFVSVALGLLLGPGARPAPAGVPLGGLAVAVSADGSRLVAGGDSRALYVLDPQSLEVKQRVPLGRSVVDLAFSADGSRLVVESTKALQILDAASWKVLKTHDEFQRMSVAQEAGLVAAITRRPAAVQVVSLADGAVQASVPYDRMQSVASFGLSPDGKRLALLYYRKRAEDETKVASKDVPKDLKGAARKAFVQHHDGYTAKLQVFEVGTTKPVLDKTLWYSASGGSRIVWHGKDALVISYNNENAKIAPDGSVAYFELGNSYNYGWDASADGSVILSGGLRRGTRTPTDSLQGVSFELDELPGFPEYWRSFSFAKDGTGYGTTSCWRVARIGPDGKILKVAPVF